MNKVEILSPCGDYNCFLSAVNAGCDAVYLSGNRYGARAYAENFNEEQLCRAIEYAHLFSVKVYLTVNTLTKNNEVDDLYEYLLPLYAKGLDGVIVQDIGVISYIRKFFPDLPVHASTQLAITGSEGVALLKELGVSRVVLAREVSLNEIKKIYKDTGIEIECFVHGALCYSYSGKCFFSSLIGGRSGNRGRCAGPCRQPYNNEQYLLSTKDICCLKLIPDLISAGIISFKIEGRMKSPEYVAAVTGIYRKHADRYYDLLEKFGESYAKEEFYKDKSLNADFDLLVKLYTRGGNSEGYYFNKNGRKMISIKDASYQTSDSALSSQIVEKYNQVKKISANAFISVKPGNEAILSVYTDDYSVSVKGAVVETSSNRPLTEEVISKQLKKTGDSPFNIDNIEYDLDSNCFMRISEINDIRRNALNELMMAYSSEYNRNIPIIDKNELIDNSIVCDYNKQKFIADIINREQLNAAMDASSVYAIYIPFDILAEIHKNNQSDLDKAISLGKKLYAKFPSVIRHDFFDRNNELCKLILGKFDGALIDNYESLKYLKDNCFKGEIVGDIHIYSLNKYALDTLKNIGFNRVTIPIELNKKEILSMNFSGEELIVYGRLPMMVSAQCVNNTLYGCDSNPKQIVLKDRKRAEFPVYNDCFNCLNTIYNSLPLSLHGEKAFVEKTGAEYLRMIFTVEDYLTTKKILDDFADYALINNDYFNDSFTRGHYNRGVL